MWRSKRRWRYSPQAPTTPIERAVKTQKARENVSSSTFLALVFQIQRTPCTLSSASLDATSCDVHLFVPHARTLRRR